MIIISGNSWPTRNGDNQICGEADASLGPDGTTQCNDQKTWPEATRICIGAGARLCTVEELEADEAASTGCSNNRKMVWSSDDGSCDDGSHALVVGYSRTVGDDKVTHCVPDNTPAAVACCADTQARIDEIGVTCGGNAPPPPIAGCISAKSCEELRALHGEWPASTYQPSVCGESDAGLPAGCVGGAQGETDGWQEAQATCYEVGARLCTVSELYTGAAYGTGCEHNGQLVWSSTECDSGHMANTLNYVDGMALQDIRSVNSCETDDTNAAVRCCADSDNARMGLEVCDLYASEESRCTSRLTCQELGDAFGGSWRQPARYGSDSVCGESDAGLGACRGGTHDVISWQEAEAACLDAGARLCTVEEVEADEARGSGCSLDAQMVWTVDDVACSPGQHVVVVGGSQNAQGRETECRDDAGTAGEGLRCCADAAVGVLCTVVAPHGTPPPTAPPPPPIDAVCQVAWVGACHPYRGVYLSSSGIALSMPL